VATAIEQFADRGGEVIFTDIALKDAVAIFPGYITLEANKHGVYSADIHNPPINENNIGPGFNAEYPSQYPGDFPTTVNIFTVAGGQDVSGVVDGMEGTVRVWMDSPNYDGGHYAILGFYFPYDGDSDGTSGVVEGMAYHPQEQVESFTGDPNSYVAGTVFFGNKMVFATKPPPRLLELTPLDETNDVGETHVLQAYLEDIDGNPIEDEAITFTVSGANAGATGQGFDINGNPVNNTNVSYTDASGVATWSYVGTNVGQDTIVATGAALVSNDAYKRWLAIPDSLVLAPQDDDNPVYTWHEVTATLKDTDGNGIEDEPITFTVISGPNAGADGTGYDINGNPVNNTNVSYTDANGEAKWSYVGTNVGTDTIEATGEGETSNEVTKTWEPPVLTLTPPSATNRPETEHTVTATLKESDGTPIQGVMVNFEVTAGPNVGIVDSDTTDVNGEATFTYTDQGLATGPDTIEATCVVTDIGMVDITDIPLQATAEKTWKRHDVIPGMTAWGTMAAVLGLCAMALLMLRRRGRLYYTTTR
jgi:hypothetical protein